jgi:hypothetical protein
VGLHQSKLSFAAGANPGVGGPSPSPSKKRLSKKVTCRVPLFGGLAPALHLTLALMLVCAAGAGRVGEEG